MDNKKDTKGYFKKWQNIKLSDSGRARIEKELQEYARFHGVSGVRVGERSRSIERVPYGVSFFNGFNFRTMPVIAIVVALVIGGGTSFAAESSLPGDLLYPVKIEVNENVKSVFAFGSESEARLQATLLEERVREAEALKADGRLEGETALALKSAIEEQREAAEEASEHSRAAVAVDTRSQVQLAINRFNALVGDANLAIDNGGAIHVGTNLSTKEVVVEELRVNTEARIESLKEVIGRNQAEFEAGVYAELSATLDQASELIVRSRTETEEESRNILIASAELAGEVESRLSLLGGVTIDEATGAIVDVDLSVPAGTNINIGAPVDPEAEGNAASSGAGSSGSRGAYGGIDVEIDAGTDIETDVLDVQSSTDGSVEATSGLGF